MTDPSEDARPLPGRSGPAVILAADHRARGIVTVEPYSEYLQALEAALPHCDGLMATAQPLADLTDATGPRDTYLSVNRTGLAGSSFELDDRLIASVGRAVADRRTGIKHMTRIDRSDPATPAGLELLGRVLEEARAVGLDAMIEPLSWSAGAVDRSVDAVVLAAVIAHDMGAPLLKVPVPEATPGPERVEAVRRVTSSVGVPVLFLGGPRRGDRGAVLAEVADAMAGGGAGMAIGRSVYLDPAPGPMARLVSDVVHGRLKPDEVAPAMAELDGSGSG